MNFRRYENKKEKEIELQEKVKRKRRKTNARQCNEEVISIKIWKSQKFEQVCSP